MRSRSHPRSLFRTTLVASAGLLAAPGLAGAVPPPAPPLTPEQLEQLRQVDTWELEYRYRETMTADGGASGLQFPVPPDLVLTGWSETRRRNLAYTARMTVRGNPGCDLRSGGDPCLADLGFPATLSVSQDSSVREGTRTFSQGCIIVEDGVQVDNIPFETFSRDAYSRSGTFTGSQVESWTQPRLGFRSNAFAIDYSTNPPRAQAIFHHFRSYGERVRTSTTTCPSRPDSQSRSDGPPIDYEVLFFHDTTGVPDPDTGDTQVRVEGDRFVIEGSARFINDDFICGPQLHPFAPPCSTELDRVVEIETEWVVRSRPQEADLAIDLLDVSPPAIHGPPEALVPLQYTVLVRNDGPAAAPAIVTVLFSLTPVGPPTGPLFLSCLAPESLSCLPTLDGVEARYGLAGSPPLPASGVRSISVSTQVRIPPFDVALSPSAEIELPPDAVLTDPNPLDNRETTVATITPFLPGTPPDGEVELTGEVEAGGEIEVSGDGFASDGTVDFFMESTPVFLGRARAGADGRVSATLVIPEDAEDGRHRILALGQGPDGERRALAATLFIGRDRIPPTSVAELSPAPNAAGWHRSDVTIDVTATDDEGGSDVGHIVYALNGAQRSGEQVVEGATARIVVDREGVTTLTWRAVDEAGNEEAPRTLTIRLDRTPPRLTCDATPDTLWPPRHALVPVSACVEVTDPLSGQSGFVLIATESSEPDDARGGGDGHTTGDIAEFVPGTPDTEGALRAERAGRGPGRTYTLTYQGQDIAGNTATCHVEVRVPHDRGHRHRTSHRHPSRRRHRR